MVSKKIGGVALALALPLLMAPMPATCRVGVSSEVVFTGPVVDEVCREDAHLTATATVLQTSERRPAGVLAAVKVRDLTLTVLERVNLSPGDSRGLTATIPWATLAADRGGMYIVVADVGVFDASVVRPGETLPLRRYDAALGEVSSMNLFARATRTFRVCD